MAVDMNGNEMPTKRLPKLNQNMMAILKSMEDLTPTHFSFIGGIYGDMGTGKTVAGMKLLQAIVPEDEKILYIYTAQGLSTFNNHPELMRRVKTMKFERQEQLVAVAKAIREARDNPELSPLHGALSKIGGVVLDEYSHMSKLDQAWIVNTRSAQFEEDGKFKDPHNPAQPDYLTQQVRSNEVITSFMDANIHFMAICHARYDDKTAVYRPDFPQGTGADLFRVLHSMYYAQSERGKTGEPVKTLQLHADRKFVAKNRIGGLGSTASVEEIVSAYKKWGINTEAADVAKEAAEQAPKEQAPVIEPTPEPVVKEPEEEFDPSKFLV